MVNEIQTMSANRTLILVGYHMINKHIALLLLSVSFFPFIAEARIGERTDACIARYGEPTKRETISEDWEEITFNKDNFVIKATFYQGTCDSIKFWKNKKKSFFSDEVERLDLSEGEIGVFMEANSKGMSWISCSESEFWYRTEDNDIFARYSRPYPALSIDTRGARNRSLDEMYNSSARRKSNAIERAKTQMKGF